MDQNLHRLREHPLSLPIKPIIPERMLNLSLQKLRVSLKLLQLEISDPWRLIWMCMPLLLWNQNLTR